MKIWLKWIFNAIQNLKTTLRIVIIIGFMLI